MNIAVKQKKIQELNPTDILFQTAYWGHVKSRLGYKPVAFDFKSSTGQQGDFLVLIKTFGNGLAVAYVPQGPELNLDPEKQGRFLEALSQALTGHMDPNVALIRYDLPWESPYTAYVRDGQAWPGHPDPRLRELRMNIGTLTWPLRKAAMDLTVADAVVVDLARTEEAIFAAMKPKTRYNIRLAQRKGVSVFKASVEMLPLFYNLYMHTAKRNSFNPGGTYRHFAALFSTPVQNSGLTEIIFLLAAKDRDILAGAIILIVGRQAIYLYGASSNKQRNLMGSYAMHWDAIKSVRAKGCLSYDMGAVSPVPDSSHPFYGMYRFKTGFSGEIVHRNGSWDYPLNMTGYKAFRNMESLGKMCFGANNG